MIELAKFYLNSSTKLKDASSQFLSNLFGRPDIQKTKKLVQYISWATETIEKFALDMMQDSFVGGIYHSLAEVFKIGQRSELLQHIPVLIKLI